MENTKPEKSKQKLLIEIEVVNREHERAVAALDDVVTDKMKINRTDLRVIDALLDGAAAPSTLVEKTGISPSAMTSVLDRLESQNYVIRNRDIEDRRKIVVEITDRCKKINALLHEPIASESLEILNKLNETELKIIYDYLCTDRDLYKRHRHRLKKEHFYIK